MSLPENFNKQADTEGGSSTAVVRLGPEEETSQGRSTGARRSSKVFTPALPSPRPQQVPSALLVPAADVWRPAIALGKKSQASYMWVTLAKSVPTSEPQALPR